MGQEEETLRRSGCGPVREDSHQEVLRHSTQGPGGDLQAADQQVLRKVHQRVPLPRGEAELPHRADEEVRAGVAHPPQEGQEVPVQQGVQAGDKAGVREPRGQEAAPRVRQDPEEHLQLQARGDMQGGREEVLLQGGEEGLGEGVHPREEACRRRYLQLCLIDLYLYLNFYDFTQEIKLESLAVPLAKKKKKNFWVLQKKKKKKKKKKS